MKASTASDDSAPARLARAIAAFEYCQEQLIDALDRKLGADIVKTRLHALQTAGKTLEGWLDAEAIAPSRHDAGT